MEHALLALFILTSLILCMTVWRQRRSIANLIAKRKEIVVEEHRMFAFLHGLGEALQTSKTQTELYQFLLDGAIKVVDAQHGALYLLDESGHMFVPRALSKHYPPALSALPDDIDPNNHAAVKSYLRLTGIPRDDSTLLGRCLKEGKGLHHQNVHDHPQAPPGRTPLAAMLSPLRFGEKELGVLIVLGKQPSFTTNDFAVFCSLADQCSLALGTASLSREAHSQKRLEEELLTAREVQRILLPEAAPPLPGFRIAGRNRAARIVSGDYFDFLTLDEHHVGVALADVSGKGIPASLMMAMGRSVLRANAAPWLSPAKALADVNRILFPDIRQDMFISMVYLILKEDHSDVVLARAGHDPPLVYRAAGKSIETSAPPGLAVGVDDGPVFERITQDTTITLESGDCLLLYTDGLSEALNAEGEEFGIDRLQHVFGQHAHAGAQHVLDELFLAVEAFVGNQPQSDDITLVVLEKT